MAKWICPGKVIPDFDNTKDFNNINSFFCRNGFQFGVKFLR